MLFELLIELRLDFVMNGFKVLSLSLSLLMSFLLLQVTDWVMSRYLSDLERTLSYLLPSVVL